MHLGPASTNTLPFSVNDMQYSLRLSGAKLEFTECLSVLLRKSLSPLTIPLGFITVMCDVPEKGWAKRGRAAAAHVIDLQRTVSNPQIEDF